jgi:hypothetical protein
MEQDQVGLDALRAQPADAVLEPAEIGGIQAVVVPGAVSPRFSNGQIGSLATFGKTHIRILLNGEAARVARVSSHRASVCWAQA